MSELTYRWDPTWTVGNAVLDDQHMVLFDICRRVHDLREAGHEITSERYMQFVDEAIRFARTHFHTEEHLLRKRGFPELEAHIQEHRQFMDYLDRILAAPEQDPMAIDQFANALRTWLVEHICESDMRYKAYFA